MKLCEEKTILAFDFFYRYVYEKLDIGLLWCMSTGIKQRTAPSHPNVQYDCNEMWKTAALTTAMRSIFYLSLPLRVSFRLVYVRTLSMNGIAANIVAKTNSTKNKKLKRKWKESCRSFD